MDEQLRDFQQAFESGYQYFYNLYFPRIHFFIQRSADSPESAEIILRNAFIQLAEQRLSLHSEEDILAFLYASANKQIADLKQKNDFLKNRKTLMGYHVDSRHANEDVARIYSETMYALYRRGNFTPASLSKALSEYIPVIEFRSDLRPAPDQTAPFSVNVMSGIISGSLLSQLIPGSPQLSEPEREQLGQWLAADFRHMLLIDELRDRKNISAAIQFFSLNHGRALYSSIRKHIRFARPRLLKSLKRFFS